MPALPSGRVTFAFTDVVGSTRAFAEHGERFVAALGRVQGKVARCTDRHGGVVVKTEGDGAFLAFPTARAAVAALTEVQTGKLDDDLGLQLRAGAHTAEAHPVAGDYLAFGVHVAARVSAAAGAGQLLVSDAVVADLESPAGTEVGAYELKDLPDPVILWRLAGDEAPPRATPVRRTNVAIPRTSFIGRRSTISDLERRLETPGLTTVVGSGGAGKTRLVSELALKVADRFAGGAWLVELAALSEDAQVPEALTTTLAVGGSPETAAAALGEALIILDNCEHVVEGAADLAQRLLDACPHLRLVCTSREPLLAVEEEVVRLGGLGEAEELFVDRARAAGAVVDDHAALARVCAALDGLPLALELAAARASAGPLALLAEAVEHDRLELRRRGGDERQRTLRDLVAWSLRLLGDEDRTALLALSLFPGRFSASDAATYLALVPGARDALTDLAHRSLVDHDGAGYRLLATVRTVVRAELATSSGEHKAHAALHRWALSRVPPVAGPPTDLDETDTMLAVQAAVRWGLDSGVEPLGPLLRWLRRWAQTAGVSATITPLAEVFLALPAAETADQAVCQATALSLVHGINVGSSDRPVDADRVRNLAAVARGTGTPVEVVEVVSVASQLLTQSPELVEEGEQLGLESLALIESDPDLLPLRPKQLGDLGVIAYLRGDLQNAIDRTEGAVLDAEAHHDPVNRDIYLYNLGFFHLERDEPQSAAAALRRVFDQVPRSRVIAAASLALLVQADLRRGAVAQASELAVEATRQLEDVARDDPSFADNLEELRTALREAGVSIDG